MIDAYTIGIRLALTDEMSVGLRQVRKRVDALGRATARSVAGLRTLARVGDTLARSPVSRMTRPAVAATPIATPPRALVAIHPPSAHSGPTRPVLATRIPEQPGKERSILRGTSTEGSLLGPFQRLLARARSPRQPVAVVLRTGRMPDRQAPLSGPPRPREPIAGQTTRRPDRSHASPAAPSIRPDARPRAGGGPPKVFKATGRAAVAISPKSAETRRPVAEIAGSARAARHVRTIGGGAVFAATPGRDRFAARPSVATTNHPRATAPVAPGAAALLSTIRRRADRLTPNRGSPIPAATPRASGSTVSSPTAPRTAVAIRLPFDRFRISRPDLAHSAPIQRASRRPSTDTDTQNFMNRDDCTSAWSDHAELILDGVELGRVIAEKIADQLDRPNIGTTPADPGATALWPGAPSGQSWS